MGSTGSLAWNSNQVWPFREDEVHVATEHLVQIALAFACRVVSWQPRSAVFWPHDGAYQALCISH